MSKPVNPVPKRELARSESFNGKPHKMLPIYKISRFGETPKNKRNGCLKALKVPQNKKDVELNRSTCGTGMPCNDR